MMIVGWSYGLRERERGGGRGTLAEKAPAAWLVGLVGGMLCSSRSKQRSSYGATLRFKRRRCGRHLDDCDYSELCAAGRLYLTLHKDIFA